MSIRRIDSHEGEGIQEEVLDGHHLDSGFLPPRDLSIGGHRVSVEGRIRVLNPPPVVLTDEGREEVLTALTGSTAILSQIDSITDSFFDFLKGNAVRKIWSRKFVCTVEGPHLGPAGVELSVFFVLRVKKHA